jgi:hypothetical protein
LVLDSAAGFDPGIDLRELALPEAADLPGGQPALVDPTINGVFGDPEVGGHVVHGDPTLSVQARIPFRVGLGRRELIPAALRTSC